MYDIIIVGGGIIGLSSAYQIIKSYPEKKLLVIEKENNISMHQTGHNSGVIHSGIYYKPGSLKAKYCRNGIKLLKKFCSTYHIKYELCGKVIIAKTENELNSLNALFLRGKKNGLKGLKLLQQNQILDYEPYVVAKGAIYCPETGIINYSDVCKKLSELISEKGLIVTGSKVSNIFKKETHLIVQTDNLELKTKFLINCAGLFSDRISEMAGLQKTSKIISFRGEYYMLKKDARHLVKNLIYPVPDPRYPFLGVHFTRTINGEVEAGPNAVLAFAREGYSKFDINLKDIWDYLTYPGFWLMASRHWSTGMKEYYRSTFKRAFLKSLKYLIPSIKAENIQKSPAGVRAQALDSNGRLIDDFIIKNTSNMIHVLNAPSPAATSSLSIGLYIKELYSSIIS